MAVNAASSSYVNNASSNKGFSGLASGVDTESMVEQLLSGTQSKIDKQEGLKQQLQWKQEIYRDIISQINSFQTKFFSFSSSSNLMSDAFFNAMSAISSSSAFKATATTSASTGSSSMEVRRLATKASITSGSTISGKLDGKLDSAALQKLIDGQLGTKEDYTVKFKVGDKSVSVDLRDVFVNDSTGTFTKHTAAVRDRLIQEKLTDAFKDTGVKASVSGGTIKLVSEGDNRQTITVSGDSGKLGLQKLGRQQELIHHGAVADQGDVPPRPQNHRPLPAGISGVKSLASTGVADGHRPPAIEHRLLQGAFQLRKAGGRPDGNARDAVQISHIEHPLVGLTVLSHQTGPVHPKHHMEALEGHVME